MRVIQEEAVVTVIPSRGEVQCPRCHIWQDFGAIVHILMSDDEDWRPGSKGMHCQKCDVWAPRIQLKTLGES